MPRMLRLKTTGVYRCTVTTQSGDTWKALCLILSHHVKYVSWLAYTAYTYEISHLFFFSLCLFVQKNKAKKQKQKTAEHVRVDCGEILVDIHFDPGAKIKSGSSETGSDKLCLCWRAAFCILAVMLWGCFFSKMYDMLRCMCKIILLYIFVFIYEIWTNFTEVW